MPRHDVAIYMPLARIFYDAQADFGAGGAERQTWLLARALTARGLRVAHIVLPIAERLDPSDGITLVQRPEPRAQGSARALAEETGQVWRALSQADASVQVLRGASGVAGIAGTWARRHGRGLLFAGASNADFTLETFGGARDPRAALFRLGLRLADGVVVQSADQVRLVEERFPAVREVREIPSFVEPAAGSDGAGEAFLWVSRLTDYKRPLLYADLAAAVPEARFWMVATRSYTAEYEPLLAELERRAAQLPNLELLPPRRHPELQELIGRAVAMVNTSRLEGMPNTWLEGWARGVPALTHAFDPDGRIERHGLGRSGGGDWDAFVAATRELWARRADRGGFGPVVRSYVAEVHGRQVGERWLELVQRAARGRR